MAGRLSWKTERIVVDQTVNTPANDTVVGAYVYYVTGKGNHGVVFIPNDKFSEQTIKETVRPDARRLDRASELAEEYD